MCICMCVCVCIRLRVFILVTTACKSTCKKTRSRLYPVETTTDADNANDLALLTNAPAQAEYLLYSLE